MKRSQEPSAIPIIRLTDATGEDATGEDATFTTL
jgi:hypothetical protein